VEKGEKKGPDEEEREREMGGDFLSRIPLLCFPIYAQELRSVSFGCG
jgi:hypothetical protein